MLHVSADDFFSTIQQNNVIYIFTDGACSGNPGCGGWGALLKQDEEELEISGGAPDTTNNRMEMMAAIASLEILPKGMEISLTTDSEYLKKGITTWIINWKKNGWKAANKNPVKNQDLWIKLDELCQYHTVNWHWVRGHSGVKENERVDALARNAIIAQKIMV